MDLDLLRYHRRLALLLLCLGLSIGMVSAIAGEPAVRTIRCRVLGVDGKPATGRTVELVGRSRISMRHNVEDEKLGSWTFTTDAHGCFVASIGEWHLCEDAQSRPGYGNYALVVQRSDNDAGAVSTPFSLSAGDTYLEALDDWVNEWGRPVAVPRQGLDMTLQIKKGITVRGRLLSATRTGKIPPETTIHTMNDLGADTHTGKGAEVLRMQTQVDSNGYFILRNVYPNTFCMSINDEDGDSDDIIRIKTRTTGKWRTEASKEITPHRGQSTLYVEILASAGL